MSRHSLDVRSAPAPDLTPPFCLSFAFMSVLFHPVYAEIRKGLQDSSSNQIVSTRKETAMHFFKLLLTSLEKGNCHDIAVCVHLRPVVEECVSRLCQTPTCRVSVAVLHHVYRAIRSSKSDRLHAKLRPIIGPLLQVRNARILTCHAIDA